MARHGITASQTAFRQNIIDINNTTGAITFTSYHQGSKDPGAPTGAPPPPNTYFSLTGILDATAAGVVPDTTKTRTISYAESGAIGQYSSSVDQASLTVSDDEMKASFFESDSGTDPSGNSISSTDKTALDVQYTGTGTASLTIYQGAGRSQLSMTGTPPNSTTTVTNSTDHTIGFYFDNTQTPNYATSSNSTYLTNIGNVNFSTDAVLSQTAPTAPDMTKIDSTPCAAAPTTVVGYVTNPQNNASYAAALASCNTFPASSVSGAPNPPINMCDPIRNQEHAVNDAIHQYQVANSAPPPAGQKK